MSRIIVHIDLNCFFARCEEIKNPALEHLPIAVGGEGRRGIISTANYEARKYGVHSAMPTYMAKRQCPKLILLPSDFAFYHEKSEEFMRFVRKYAVTIEKASVDECYVDMTEELKGVPDVRVYFLTFQEELLKTTGLYCSIGIGPTKFLAKMGSDYKKPNGLTIIRRRDVPKIIFPLPIDDMYGIGKKNAPRLHQLGIHTIGDLAKDDSYEVKKTLGKFYYVLKDWAIGKGDDHVETEPWDPKSIGHSSTFLEDTEDYEEIKKLLLDLTKEVTEEAKRKRKKGNTVQIVLKYSDFHVRNRSMKMSEPANDFQTVFLYVMKIFDKHYQGEPIRLAGVTLQNLQDEEDIVVQMSLFNYQKHEEESATKLLIQELNRKLETPMFKRASEVKSDKK